MARTKLNKNEFIDHKAALLILLRGIPLPEAPTEVDLKVYGIMQKAADTIDKYVSLLEITKDEVGILYNIAFIKDEEGKHEVAGSLGEPVIAQLIDAYFFKKKDELVRLAGNAAIKKYVIRPDETKTRQIKVSGHWIDKSLRYNYPVKTSVSQPTLWDQLLPPTKNKLVQEGVSVEMVNRNGDSTPLDFTHYKLIDCLYVLLSEKSRNVYNKQSPDYYGGEEAMQTPIGNSPMFWINLYEIAKIYTGGKRVAGAIMETVAGIVEDLADNPEMKVLFRYQRSRGEDKVVIEDYANIIKLINVRKYKKNVEIDNEKGKGYFIAMHPIFIDQIATKWVSYPHDITDRMIDANGGSKIPIATYKLRDLLARYHSSKEYNPKIIQDKLFYCIAEKSMINKRRGEVEKMYERAVETCIKIGLIKDVHVTTAKTSGEIMYVFELHKEWE
jgi:hypothetical protein